MQALLLIDLQRGILAGPPAVVGAETLLAQVRQLVAQARAAGVPIIFVQHDGPAGHRTEVGTPGWELHPALGATAADLVVHKRECDAFFDTGLLDTLRERGVTELVVGGCMTQFCIDTTVRRAFSLGFEVILAGDAHGTAHTPTLTAGQIIEHHNAALEAFGSGAHPHDIHVLPTRRVRFKPKS